MIKNIDKGDKHVGTPGNPLWISFWEEFDDTPKKEPDCFTSVVPPWVITGFKYADLNTNMHM